MATPKKVLLIDDELEIVDLIKSRLVENGYDVIAASNGLDGLEIAKNQKPNLILLDILMPKMTGYQFVTELKKIEALRKIPILILSARGDMRDFFNSWDIQGFIEKPFEWDDMLSKIHKAIGGEESMEKVDIEPVEKVIQKRILVAGVEEFVVNKIVGFLRSKDFIVDHAQNEAEVIELAQSNRPDYIFIQYWQNRERFDVWWVYQSLQKNLRTQSIPLMVYSADYLASTATKIFETNQVITYSSSGQLLDVIRQLL